jgi:tubulin-specific chaperone A
MAGASIVKKPVDECIGKKCYDLFNMKHCKTEKCLSAKAMDKDMIVTADTTANLLDGELPIRYTTAPLKDDTGNIIGTIEYIVDITDEMKVAKMAEMISKGDYSVEIEKRSEEDRLSIALNSMTKTLREVTEENIQQNWLKTGQTELNDKMRGEENIISLAGNILSFFADYLNVQIAALYSATNGNRSANNGNLLKLVATYAYTKRKNLSNQFKFGDGLVGQAALEKKQILLSNVPDDYITISSGLGKAVPHNILVKPFMYEGEVKGVIELGKFDEFTDKQMAFLDNIIDNIGIVLNSAEGRSKMKELLEQTQRQASELQTQQEELRQTNEELEEQTKELMKKEERLEAQQEELREANVTLKDQTEELEKQTSVLEEQKNDIVKSNDELEKAHKEIENRAKELETASKYKSEFLANMSHELRTPLNSILILSSLLSNNKDNNLTEKQVEFGKTIHSAGSDLLNLINDILDLSKVESGKMDLHIDDMDLRDFANNIELNFKHIAKEKALSFNTNLADNLPPHIRTDIQRVEQIIKNLLSNAFKFCSEGAITLDIGYMDDGVDLSNRGLDPKKTISFSVSDTGEGIAEDKQKLIFQAFQQADGSINRQFGGTGLGLFISTEFARLLGGFIHLKSEEGKGSTFTLYIPVSLEEVSGTPRLKDIPPLPSKQANRETTKQEEQITNEPNMEEQITNEPNNTTTEIDSIYDDRKKLSPGDKSILIIDDDPKFSKILCDLSHEKDFKVLVAEDGETGLHFADYYRPSAIILDIGLPGIDGWTVMARLKENPELRHIPVHFISALDKTPEAIKMGAVGYLNKPVSVENLEKTLKKLKSYISKTTKNLLVIEDNEIQRKSIVELIDNKGVSITAVSTGKEAYSILKSNKIDCIILDIGLPDMSGIELLTKIRNNKALHYIPIIIYTGRELTEEEETTISKYTEKIIIKSAKSPERLLEETTLFLHSIEEDLPNEKQEMLRMSYNKESILKDKKILLVDDDMRNVFALTNILEEKDIKILVGRNGKEGLDRLNNDPDVDLVLMDIMMPEMNGYEAIKEIRKQKRFKKLPIIALTAKAMKGDRAKCIEAGSNDYMAKPIDSEKLLSLLRVWLY